MMVHYWWPSRHRLSVPMLNNSHVCRLWHHISSLFSCRPRWRHHFNLIECLLLMHLPCYKHLHQVWIEGFACFLIRPLSQNRWIVEPSVLTNFATCVVQHLIGWLRSYLINVSPSGLLDLRFLQDSYHCIRICWLLRFNLVLVSGYWYILVVYSRIYRIGNRCPNWWHWVCLKCLILVFMLCKILLYQCIRHRVIGMSILGKFSVAQVIAHAALDDGYVWTNHSYLGLMVHQLKLMLRVLFATWLRHSAHSPLLEACSRSHPSPDEPLTKVCVLYNDP